MKKQTALLPEHQKCGGLLVDFAGWEMPLHYGSQLNEHHFVRNDAGMFDVSHMTVIDLSGERTTEFLRFLLSNDVAKLKTPGKALYTCMLNEQGGIIDDLIVYYFSSDAYRLVVNAATRDKDLAWIKTHAEPFSVKVSLREDLGILAVQGPNAIAKTQAVLSPEKQLAVAPLSLFSAIKVEDWMIARTGYTGEQGYEIILPTTQMPAFWQALLTQGVKPCGLGARDTLRLEAGLNLYGTDMDESVTPLEANLAWTVAFKPEDRNFIGRAALLSQQVAGLSRQLVGIVLEGRGVLRHGQRIIVPEIGEGEITSGGFSPTLKCGIAFAMLPIGFKDRCQVDIRGKLQNARIITLPFVKQGKATFTLQGEQIS